MMKYKTEDTESRDEKIQDRESQADPILGVGREVPGIWLRAEGG